MRGESVTAHTHRVVAGAFGTDAADLPCADPACDNGERLRAILRAVEQALTMEHDPRSGSMSSDGGTGGEINDSLRGEHSDEGNNRRGGLQVQGETGHLERELPHAGGPSDSGPRNGRVTASAEPSEDNPPKDGCEACGRPTFHSRCDVCDPEHEHDCIEVVELESRVRELERSLGVASKMITNCPDCQDKLAVLDYVSKGPMGSRSTRQINAFYRKRLKARSASERGKP